MRVFTAERHALGGAGTGVSESAVSTRQAWVRGSPARRGRGNLGVWPAVARGQRFQPRALRSGHVSPPRKVECFLHGVAPSNSSLQPTPTRHSKYRKLYAQRGRVGAAELCPLCGVGPSRHGSPSVVEAGHALAARRRSRPSTRWGFFRVCRMLLHVRRSHLRRSGSPWLRRRSNHECVVSGKIVVAARPHAALLPRVGSAVSGRPSRAFSARCRGGQVTHVPRVRWPQVCRRSRCDRRGAAVGC